MTTLRVLPGFDLVWTEPLTRCPDVFSVEVFGRQGHRVAQVATVYRYHGEDDRNLWQRALATAKSLGGDSVLPWETVGWIRASTMTVMQAMRCDDKRENQRLLLYTFLHSDLAEIRVLGAHLLIQFYGLDRP